MTMLAGAQARTGGGFKVMSGAMRGRSAGVGCRNQQEVVRNMPRQITEAEAQPSEVAAHLSMVEHLTKAIGYDANCGEDFRSFDKALVEGSLFQAAFAGQTLK